MKRSTQLLALLGMLVASAGAMAAGADLGQAEKQATNWTAITMFGLFVAGTRDRFLRVIRDEAGALTVQFEKAASAFSNDLRERWLLEEILGAELLAVAARRIGERRSNERRALAVKSENVDEDLWLRVDSFGLLQALRYLALRLQDEYEVREVRLSLTRSGSLAQFDLSWLGTFMNNETAMSWLQDPMAVAGESSPLRVTDVIERSNGDIWFQRERVSHRAFFRTMLAVAEAPRDLPRAIVPAPEGEDVVITAVSDGDTATAVIEGRPLRLWLARIDAPEHRQAWGPRVEQSLRQLVWRKQVHIEWREVDRNGRPIVTMTVDGLDVSEEQVRRGMSWVYRAYSKDPQLHRLEADAREARLGLWADAIPVPPWEWRRMKRDGEALQ